MDFLPISLRVVKELATLSFAVLSLGGCSSVYELYAPPGANFNPPRQGLYEDPDKYKVSSSENIRYRTKSTFSPPRWRYGNMVSSTEMPDILPSDIWVVTHRFRDRLIIYSATYQARQTANTSYQYHLFIDSSGRVNSGWLLLHNPKAVLLARDRFTIMDPKQSETDGWPDEILFVEVK